MKSSLISYLMIKQFHLDVSKKISSFSVFLLCISNLLMKYLFEYYIHVGSSIPSSHTLVINQLLYTSVRQNRIAKNLLISIKHRNPLDYMGELLQEETNMITKWGSFYGDMWQQFYYILRQSFLQYKAFIGKWGVTHTRQEEINWEMVK